jgi:hypothetical protein
MESRVEGKRESDLEVVGKVGVIAAVAGLQDGETVQIYNHVEATGW